MDVYAPQTWLPHERPLLPGSPSTPLHSDRRRLAYLIVGFIILAVLLVIFIALFSKWSD